MEAPRPLLIEQLPRIIEDRCTGCSICALVCPTLAIKMIRRLPVVELDRCIGCSICEARCPEDCIEMTERGQPLVIRREALDAGQEAEDLCHLAMLNPQQVICFCVGTRAREVASAIIRGGKRPEEISLLTGIRSGCGVGCVTPMLRLLRAAGVALERAERGWQLYGSAPTIWDIKPEVVRGYEEAGYPVSRDSEALSGLVARHRR